MKPTLRQKLKKHFKNLSYIVRHKYFVFRAGLKTGCPWFRLIVHDWSKFTPIEWMAYTEYFYGVSKQDRDSIIIASVHRYWRAKYAFDKAWLHHQHLNDHHWQHWLLHNDDGSTYALRMPDAAVREMVADWAGAGRTITGKWEVRMWFEKNESRIILHPETHGVVYEYLKNF